MPKHVQVMLQGRRGNALVTGQGAPGMSRERPENVTKCPATDQGAPAQEGPVNAQACPRNAPQECRGNPRGKPPVMGQGAPRLPWQCLKNALRVPQECPENASGMHQESHGNAQECPVRAHQGASEMPNLRPRKFWTIAKTTTRQLGV